MDSHLGNRRVHQQQPSQGKDDNSADRQHSMRGKFRFERKQNKRGKDQDHGRKARGQQVQRENGQQDEHHSNGSRNHCTGMIELGVKRERADGQQNKGDIRVQQVSKNMLLQRHVKWSNGLTNQIEHNRLTVESLDLLALQLLEKIVFTWRYVVNQFFRQRFLVGERLRL